MSLIHQISPIVVGQMLEPDLNPASFVTDLERTA